MRAMVLRWLPLGGLCLLVMSAFMLCLPPAESGAVSHPFLFELPPPPEEEGEEEEGEEGEEEPYFENPCGLAVDVLGNVYISDYYHHKIDVYSSEASKLLSVENVDLLNGPCGLAVNSGGHIYVNNFHQDVAKFVPSTFPFVASTFFGPEMPLIGEQSTGVALDSGSSNIYVNHRTYIGEYQQSGAPVLSGGIPVRIGLGTLGDAYGLAISDFPLTSGYLYVPDAADNTVKVYDPTVDLDDPIGVIDGSGNPEGGFSSLRDAAITVDKSNGHVYVVDNLQPQYSEYPRAVVNEFNDQGQFRGQFPNDGFLIHGGPSGLAVDNSPTGSQGRIYVTDGNTEGGTVKAFGPAGPAYSLTVSKSGAGSGVVTSAPAGINCGGACAAEYDAGKPVTLVATPDAGSMFSGWSGGGCSGSGACVVSMSEARAVTADFVAAPVLLRAARPDSVESVSGAPPKAGLSGVRLALDGVLMRPHVNIFRVSVSEPGLVVAGGAKVLTTATARAVGAERVRLRLSLSHIGRQVLKTSKIRSLRVKVAIKFIPADGGAEVVMRKGVTFGPARTRPLG